MSISNNDDGYDEFENIRYIIQCIYYMDYTNLGIGTMLFGYGVTYCNTYFCVVLLCYGNYFISFTFVYWLLFYC